jgi:3-O-alpha-D-mannopyranosyl-alpha-D-mannopyranose xylosylphosphotransferase
MAFLATHMRIERWREALLWSWTVAKVGSADGVWGDGARRHLRDTLGVEGVEGEKVKIRRAARDTLDDVDSNFRRAGWEPPLATEFRFCKRSSQQLMVPV